MLFQLHKVGNVQESIALEADIHECRLHSGENSGDAPFVDRSCEGVFVLALKINFSELVVLDEAHLGFVWRRGHKQFFCHAYSGDLRPLRATAFTGAKTRRDGEESASRWVLARIQLGLPPGNHSRSES